MLHLLAIKDIKSHSYSFTAKIKMVYIKGEKFEWGTYQN